MVSVIIPNYNHAPYLQQRIKSVLNQTFQDFEIILMDDCSSDDSVALLETYRSNPKVSHIVCNSINSGSTFKQWERGLALAQGDWIWIAESDDFCEPNFLEEILNSPDGYDIRYAISVPVDKQGKNVSNHSYPMVTESEYGGVRFLIEFLLTSNYLLNASSVLIKRELLKKTLTKDICEFRLCGDWLVWIKSCLETNVRFVSTTASYHRFHDKTVREQSKVNGVYVEELQKFRRSVRIVINRFENADKEKLLKINENRYAHELGLIGCDLIKQNEKLRSISFILRATWKLKFSLYYIRSAFYWLIKTL